MTKSDMMAQLSQMNGKLPYTGQTWGWPETAGAAKPFTADQKFVLDRHIAGMAQNRSTFSDSLIGKCTQDASATCGFVGFLDSDGSFPQLYTGSTASVTTRQIATNTTITRSTLSSSGWNFSITVGGAQSGVSGGATIGYNTTSETSMAAATGLTETVTWQSNNVSSYPQLRMNGGYYSGYAFVKYWSTGFGINADPYGWNVAIKPVRALVVAPGQDSPATWFLVKS
ncbi:hypothetical protein AB0N62_44255 [Streptomyces sp. NPDC093982]|uniref:hypothetical protein n=1 Tax=Streptomyces sp. NPDC093982 TaxID=3155077 RepID=UPI00341BECAF